MLPTSPHLNIASLSRLFDNKSECYKLFWFQAILRFVCEQGRRDMTFHELIDSMIADAWYMVTEYHLNLGPRDTLERVVRHIHDTTGMPSSTRRDDLLAWLRECSDPVVIRCKRDLTLHVPFRLQAPFLSSFREEDWKCGSRELASRINAQDRLMYYFEGSGERVAGGRYFHDMTADSLRALLEETSFCVEDLWTSGDVRPDRAGERWVNALARSPS